MSHVLRHPLVGRHNGVSAKLRTIKKPHYDSSLANFHCTIPRQNLSAKILELDRFIKTANDIRGRALNQRLLSQLLEDMGSKFIAVPFYSKFCCLTCHKVLKRFNLLRQEINVFGDSKCCIVARTTWLPVSRKYKRSTERTSVSRRPTSDVTPTTRDL